jgi:outer membrane protein OmpA-like peptidoglycan-associated protein
MLIIGNCDKFGGEHYNKLLGEWLAEAIRGVFISLGINEDRIFTASLGSAKADLNVRNTAKDALDRRCNIVLQVK